MKKVILIIFLIVSTTGCIFDKIADPPESNNVLMLKVDFQTNTFEGGKELTFTKESETFKITNVYNPPGDFGNLRLVYSEIDETLFYGTIIWMGKGEITFPENILTADKFDYVATDDYVIPSAGFENVFNPNEKTYDYNTIWSSVQALVKVRQYLRSNPDATVKLFLYTPSVGMGNPADWDWIIFLKS